MPDPVRFRRLVPAPALEVGSEDLDAVWPLFAHAPGVLRVNFVSSADGAAHVRGRSNALSSEADRRSFHLLRAACDAVLVGAGTARAEHYGPGKVAAEHAGRRAAGGLPPVPRIALVTRSCNVDPAQRVFAEASADALPLVLTVAAADRARKDALAGLAEVVECGDEEVDLAAALAALHGRGLSRVLCEGGPTLFADLVAADLVDELCLTVAPLLVGAGPGRIAAGEARRAEPAAFELTQLLESGGALLARYRRV